MIRSFSLGNGLSNSGNSACQGGWSPATLIITGVRALGGGESHWWLNP
jgi:hypothetical protein